MNKPVLVIMAAGVGSRYGGKLKQLDSIGTCGEPIMEFSIYDAKKAGFEDVVFIIKKEIESKFKSEIGDRIAKYMNVSYAYQELDALPSGYSVPADRTKPWGTAHALLCAKDLIDGPFAVINADDYYGTSAFELIYNYLTRTHDDSKFRYGMVSYELKNTTSPNGTVSRGVCSIGENSYLSSIQEYTKIKGDEQGNCEYSEDDGATFTPISGDAPVSMNLWGFSKSFLDEIERRFPAFLDEALKTNPQKAEYFLPSVVSALMEEEKATVKVLPCKDKWYGITYHEDKFPTVLALSRITRAGVYPQPLFGTPVNI
ncbi:MAG: nucleotidyltransferase [Eubacterium sp.]|nr:nucleotidyltransferase [Eubacterium sp.]